GLLRGLENGSAHAQRLHRPKRSRQVPGSLPAGSPTDGRLAVPWRAGRRSRTRSRSVRGGVWRAGRRDVFSHREERSRGERGMKRVIVTISLALALASAAVQAQAASGQGLSAIASNDSVTGTLYVLQSAGGSLEPAANGLRLVLRRPYTKVTTFLDRPGHLGSEQTLSSVVNGWGRAFGRAPPNAALQIDGAPPAHDLVLLELDPPRYDRAKRTLTFAVRRLTGTASVHLRTLAREADASVARRFGRATLFVDDAAPVFGYTVELNLFAPATSSSTIDFSLTLDNSQFMEGPSLVQQLPFGQATTPLISSLVTGQQMSLNFPAGLQLIGTMIIDLPASGEVVQAHVEL